MLGLWERYKVDSIPAQPKARIELDLGLLGSHRGDHASTVLLRGGFNFSEFGKFGDHGFHDFPSFFDVSHLTTAEEDRNLDLVFVLQEPAGLSNFGVDVVLTRLGTKANFLGPSLVRVGAVVFLLVLFVLVLAEVHDSANRRLFVGSHLNKIKASLASSTQGVVGRNDAQLSTVGSNNSNW